LKWTITYAIEREEELVADNFNAAYKQADEEIKEGERIICVRLKR